MRAIFIVAALAVTGALVSSGQAQTDMSQVPYYPWCTLSWDNEGEYRSCGFTSYEQCINAARSHNEMCFANIWGPKPASATRPQEQRSHK